MYATCQTEWLKFNMTRRDRVVSWWAVRTSHAQGNSRKTQGEKVIIEADMRTHRVLESQSCKLELANFGGWSLELNVERKRLARVYSVLKDDGTTK